MKSITACTILLLTTLVTNGQITILQEEKHLAILKKGQKIFLEKRDYMDDKILKVTEKDDTVFVIEAEKAFFKFKIDTLIAWSLTHQVNEIDGVFTIPAVYTANFPFEYLLKSDCPVYSQAKKESDKILDLKEGRIVSVTGHYSSFFEIKYKDVTGYVDETKIISIKTEHPIQKALSEISNSHNYTPTNTDTKTKSTGRTYYRGPKGGCYYINSAGKKVYVDHYNCN